MSIFDYNNLRQFVLDIHDEITPSNAVVYQDSIDETVLQIRLIDNSYYYTIPENAKIRVYIEDSEIDASNIVLIDRFKGLFAVTLNSNLFDLIDNQYEVVIEIYCAEPDIGYGDSVSLTLKTTLFYSTSYDDLTQSIQSYRFQNTTYSIPNNPNPDWDQFLE